MVTATGRPLHHDKLLSAIAVEAWSEGVDEFIADQVFPSVPVEKQSDRYAIIRKGAFLRVTDGLRAPRARAKRVTFDVSSDSYFAHNYALAAEIPIEDIDNADQPFRVRENHTRLIVTDLRRGQEVRVANLVTSATNLGSGTLLTGSNKWSNAASDPQGQISTAHAFIRQRTGLVANTAIIDADTLEIMRRHPALLDMYKYTSGGELNADQIRAVLKVQRVLIGVGVRENQGRNVDNETLSSMTNIWGNNVVIARIEPAVSPQTRTLGLRFGWRSEAYPDAFAVLRQRKDGAGDEKVEIVEAGNYQDERIIAPELGYCIANTL